MSGQDPIYRKALPRLTTLRMQPFEQDFQEDHLTSIGKVSIYFNYMESALDRLLVNSLGIDPKIHLDFTTRISSQDAKVELTRKAITTIQLPKDVKSIIAESIGDSGFKKLKSYRNRIIHATMMDKGTHIGVSNKRQGKKEEIYLHPDAIGGVSERILHLTNEINHHAHTARLSYTISIRKQVGLGGLERILEQLRASHLKALEDRQYRLDLPSLPRLPPAPIYLDLNGEFPESDEDELSVLVPSSS